MKASKRRLRSTDDLSVHNLIKASDAQVLKAVSERYAIGVTDHLTQLINADESGVVARQYIPDMRELKESTEELLDPISDETFTPVPGIVHRYNDRVLLKIAQSCAVYCRYCFRREMVGQGQALLSGDDLENALSYIRNHSEIFEVVLTGGDPLIVSPARLRQVLQVLEDIPHVRIIRIHTRVPIADPKRMTSELSEVLKITKPVYMALHINHAQEITHDVVIALKRLQDVGVVLLSQSVLLKGINDDAETLVNLFRECLVYGIKPYYIHHPDLARGTKHFRLSLRRGREIIKSLRGVLTGIAQPSYMLDIPGGHGKIPVNDSYVREIEAGIYELTDYKGCVHIYKDDCDD